MRVLVDHRSEEQLHLVLAIDFQGLVQVAPLVGGLVGRMNPNAFSRPNLGARLAYNWEVGSNITLIPEVRGFWMHEFLNNPRNISSSLDGGNGASFDYETRAPYRNSVFGGVGISAKFADRWSASVFYNVNFGAEGYTNN